MFHGGSSLRKFLTNQKNPKIQKCPKSFPKVSKHGLNMFWGKLFKKFYAQCSMEGRVFENFQIFFSKFQKCPKSFPKVSKPDLNMFWGKLFEKFYAQCSMEGRVFENFQRNQNNCKIPKMPKIVPKSIQTCFELVLGQTF